MTITKKTIENYYPEADEIKQVGSKQLFVLHNGNWRFYVSYLTIVAAANDVAGKVWYTSDWYSRTTTGHLGLLRRGFNKGLEAGYIQEDQLKKIWKSITT